MVQLTQAGAVLTGPGLSSVLRRTGLQPEDAAVLRTVAARVVQRRDSLAEVNRLAAWLRGGIGTFPGERTSPEWPGYEPGADPYGAGVLPLLALLLTVDDLADFHRHREIPAAVTEATLRELGQQVWVHRLTFGTFGLHTYDWLPVTWSGSLYWLGRLQLNLERLPSRGAGEPEWVCSTHIPRAGRLEPEEVQRSFAWAADFFPRHFPERPLRDLWCSSWLLDPELAAALGPGTNIARFQRRWHLYGEPMPGDEDAVYFTFAHRGEVDLALLPQDTSLQRAVVARLRAGGHWTSRRGRIPLAEVAGTSPAGLP